MSILTEKWRIVIVSVLSMFLRWLSENDVRRSFKTIFMLLFKCEHNNATREDVFVTDVWNARARIFKLPSITVTYVNITIYRVSDYQHRPGWRPSRFPFLGKGGCFGIFLIGTFSFFFSCVWLHGCPSVRVCFMDKSDFLGWGEGANATLCFLFHLFPTRMGRNFQTFSHVF